MPPTVAILSEPFFYSIGDNKLQLSNLVATIFGRTLVIALYPQIFKAQVIEQCTGVGKSPRHVHGILSSSSGKALKMAGLFIQIVSPKNIFQIHSLFSSC